MKKSGCCVIFFLTPCKITCINFIHTKTKKTEKGVFMTPQQTIEQAKGIFTQMDENPQKAYTILSIANSVGNDPQKIMAVLAIARFLKQSE